MVIKIKNKKIGEGHPTFIIAEASSNHGRDLARAKKMIDAAASAGADAVKFQVFTAEKIAADTDDPRTIVRVKEKSVFVDKDTRLIDLYRKNELPREWLPLLASYAEEKGIMFLATPFDEEAVDELEAVGVPAYKIASPELVDIPLLRKVAKTGKPMIISTAMADLDEIKKAVEAVKKVGNQHIVLLHCCGIYPSPPEDINLRAMQTIQEAFSCPVGYSDHSLGIEVPIAAVARGASIIEKHFMLDDNIHTIDDKFSLTPRELKTMVKAIRKVEKALGSSDKKPSKKEVGDKARGIGRRSLWIVRDIKKGGLLTENNIKSLRPGIGISSIHYDRVIGKKAAHPLSAGKPLEKEDIAPGNLT